MIPNNSEREGFLAAISSHKENTSCCLLQLLRLWTEMKKLRKPAERQLRGNQREVQSKEPQIDTVGDKEWVWGRKLKEKEKGGGRKCTLYSPPQYLLFPFLLFSVFFFSASHFSLPCWGSPSSLHVLYFKQSTTLHLILFWNNRFFFSGTHTRAGRNKTSQAGSMNRVGTQGGR